MYTVYKHTSPSGKIYIGITKQKVQDRWKKGKGYKGQVFELAIKKYGWGNIIHEIIYEGLTKNEAEKIEIDLIKKYKSNNKKYGYNVEEVSNKIEENKNKIKELTEAKKWSTEAGKVRMQTEINELKNQNGELENLNNAYKDRTNIVKDFANIEKQYNENQKAYAEERYDDIIKYQTLTKNYSDSTLQDITNNLKSVGQE